MRLADLAPVKLLLPAIPLVVVALVPAPAPVERLPQPVREEVTLEIEPPPAPPKPGERAEHVTACP